MIDVLVGGRLLLWEAEEVVGEGDGLQDLEERGWRSLCASQAGEDRVKGGSPLLDRDIEFGCEGGFLDVW